MGLWLRDGRPIGVCSRCSRKMYLDDLSPDPNNPGLRVCEDDLDLLDPYRLPARRIENITIHDSSPDTPLDPPP